MFGLFQSKSEKSVKKLYKLHRELFSASRNALKKNTDFWWNYVFQTGEHMKKVFEELVEEKGDDYAESIMMALIKEQSLPEDHQEIILEKFMMSGNMMAFAKVFLVNEELETEIIDRWTKES